MEVKEIFKLEDSAGRVLHVHMSEDEIKTTLQAGLFYLLQQGFINYKSIDEALVDLDEAVPPDATPQ